jgi:hypothetical protein
MAQALSESNLFKRREAFFDGRSRAVRLTTDSRRSELAKTL